MFANNKKIKMLCITAMLIAVTVVLGYVSGMFRIGNGIKFSLSFISVYAAAYFFGPLTGGFVGAAADIISYFVNPTGVFLWQLTLIEFINGAFFGFFLKKTSRIKFIYGLMICVILRLAVNLFVKTPVLMSVGYLPGSFKVALGMRLLPALVISACELIMIPALKKIFEKMKV